MQNALESNELQIIWVHKTFKIEMQKWGTYNSLICRNFKTLRKVLLNHAECIEI